MFENTRFADKEIDINDLTQQSSNDFQNAFGSSSGGGGNANIPFNLVSGLSGGGSTGKLSSNGEANHNNFDSYQLTNQT